MSTLKELRQHLHISQVEAAKRCGISQANYSKIERGLLVTTTVTQQKIILGMEGLPDDVRTLPGHCREDRERSAELQVQYDRPNADREQIETLRDLRLSRGYTQQQVAEIIGVTVGTVSRWENTKRYISMYSGDDRLGYGEDFPYDRLCELYGVTVLPDKCGYVGRRSYALGDQDRRCTIHPPRNKKARV